MTINRRRAEMPGKFAPKFAQLNDDVLFGEVWSREKTGFRFETAAW